MSVQVSNRPIRKPLGVAMTAILLVAPAAWMMLCSFKSWLRNIARLPSGYSGRVFSICSCCDELRIHSRVWPQDSALWVSRLSRTIQGVWHQESGGIFNISYFISIDCIFFLSSRISICSGVIRETYGVFPCRSSRNCFIHRVMVERSAVIALSASATVQFWSRTRGADSSLNFWRKFLLSLGHLCCSEVNITPLFRWPNSVSHYAITGRYSSLDYIGFFRQTYLYPESHRSVPVIIKDYVRFLVRVSFEHNFFVSIRVGFARILNLLIIKGWMRVVFKVSLLFCSQRMITK